MSDYTKSINFTAKDALPTGDPDKKVKGADMDTEFNLIATMSATKANKIGSPTANNVIKQTAAGDLADAGYSFSALTGAVTATLANLNQLTTNTFTGLVTFSSSIKMSPVAASYSAGAYTATLGETAYATNAYYAVRLGSSTATTTPTLNLDGLGAKNIVAVDGGAIKLLDMQAGMLAIFRYDGTNMVLQNTAGGSGGGAVMCNESDYGYYPLHYAGSSYQFDIDASIGSAFESIGPTGSGATNIWPAMDNIPLDADWVRMRITGSHLNGSASSNLSTKIYSELSTGTGIKSDGNIVYAVGARSDGSGNAYAYNVAEFTVRVDSSNIFEMATTLGFTTESIEMKIVGYGYN